MICYGFPIGQQIGMYMCFFLFMTLCFVLLTMIDCYGKEL